MDCIEPAMTTCHLETDLHPLLGRRVLGPNPTWEAAVSLDHLPFLRDHWVNGAIIFPRAGYIEAALAAQRESCPQAAGIVENLEFRRLLTLGVAPRHLLRVEIGGR